jgi:adenosylcobinamide-phosphate synthase
MSNILIALIAYLTERVFGEFSFFSNNALKHPIVVIGEIITYFEDKFYQDSLMRGVFLVAFVVSITASVALVLELFLAEFHYVIYIIASSFVASIFISHATEEREKFNEAVVAPIFYLLIFGLLGMIIYKTISTLNSKVGYKKKKYEKYGKAAFLLSVTLNYIPSRITALIR